MSWGNLRIGVRLGLGFGLGIILTLIMGIISIGKLKAIAEMTTQLYQYPYAISMAGKGIETGVVKINRSMKDVALAKDSAQIDAAVAAVDAAEKGVLGDFDILRDRFLGDKKEINEFRKVFVDWKPIREEVIALTRAGERDKAAGIIRTKGTQVVQAITKDSDRIILFAKDKAAEFVKNAQAFRDQALFMLYLMFGCLIALVAVAGFFITRSITRPLNEAVNASQKIADANLTWKLTCRAKMRPAN